ncbi:PST family polysaccharide transporter [Microbacterium ginsengiterrae]|uniref:PST family polysaccharide transporter n=2 Tax=Microbacterium ginsengiterrae TaxID=546115 RepID=A0A7W9CD60_9MICO|nr:PST family polysaccharide transporter [Microbacterium ginsengiterrae]
MLGSQAITFLSQLVYVAVTSRLISAAGFGAYAVAASVTALVGLLTNGGIAQAAMRADRLSDRDSSSLTSIALLLGAGGAAFTVATAELWGTIWGVPSASRLLIASAPILLLSPISLLAQGLVRRLGGFRLLALVSASVSVVSLGISAGLAVVMRDPISLVIAPALTMFLTLVVLQARTKALRRPRALQRAVISHLQFTWRVTVGGILSYLGMNLPKFFITRSFGAPELGVWNRAESAVLSPFQMLQKALAQTIYPELRNVTRSENTGNAAKFSDLLIVVSWVTVLPAALVAVLVPPLLPLFLGPEWQPAIQLAVAMAILAGLTAMTSILSSALEVAGKFKVTYASQVVQILIVTTGCIAMLITGEIQLVIWGMIAATVMRHTINLTAACRLGYADARVLSRGYWGVALGAVCVAAVVAGGVLVVVLHAPAWIAILYGFGVAGLGAIAFLVRERLPPIALARKYGLI